ncbi:hypothetical protein PVK62_10375 [Aliivibrio sp. S3MY1]|uniref:hypothetical protein n=1 Tax=unclassified Aliivibrio TaxID=2645654 RepID=UPI002379C446|nr:MULTISPECIES: hypothetical protein [unclassified Aliivibrio]MDD9196237.1 hypothetical protein [Aliivibrio sp. S3MY1]MDD9199610.1 hypothetical protein [Aliivibrio sp. S2MY1]
MDVLDKQKLILEAAFSEMLTKNKGMKISSLLSCGSLGMNNNSIDYLSIEEIIYLKLIVNLHK